jgi:RNA polymerase sigma factor (sigma-70 family)
MSAKLTALLPLFLAERGRMIRLIDRIVKCRATAEDLAQDAFLRLWGRVVTDKDRSLLFRTAQNLAIDHVRTQRVRVRYREAIAAEQIAAAAPVPDATAATREEIKSLLQALRTLPERTQRTFLLNRLDGYSYPEIAKALGVSLSTVEKDMMRALEVCRTWLTNRSGC